MKYQKKLDQDVIDALQAAEYRDDGLSLGQPGSMPAAQFRKVAKALTDNGFKWHSKPAVYRAKDGGDAQQAIDAILEAGGYLDVRKAFQFFPTVPEVARRMARALFDGREYSDHMERLLEPSAGHGALCIAAREYGYGGYTCAVEVQESFTGILDYLHRDQVIDSLVIRDFLDMQFEWHFDHILMNPPFNGGRDIAHVRHALRSLAPGGRLVCLISAGTDVSRLVGSGTLGTFDVEVLEDQIVAGTETGARSRMVQIDRIPY